MREVAPSPSSHHFNDVGPLDPARSTTSTSNARIRASMSGSAPSCLGSHACRPTDCIARVNWAGSIHPVQAPANTLPWSSHVVVDGLGAFTALAQVASHSEDDSHSTISALTDRLKKDTLLPLTVCSAERQSISISGLWPSPIEFCTFSPDIRSLHELALWQNPTLPDHRPSSAYDHILPS